MRPKEGPSMHSELDAKWVIWPGHHHLITLMFTKSWLDVDGSLEGKNLESRHDLQLLCTSADDAPLGTWHTLRPPHRSGDFGWLGSALGSSEWPPVPAMGILRASELHLSLDRTPPTLD